ncbi:hypothetical protein BJ741DRAFT_626232 [Chytriomyces cf. hyalinus JEL632]|nr:hypothetical protein BJ741DRAFT_626232 [Chytriomyces cf. hyalinus JEL632]
MLHWFTPLQTILEAPLTPFGFVPSGSRLLLFSVLLTSPLRLSSVFPFVCRDRSFSFPSLVLRSVVVPSFLSPPPSFPSRPFSSTLRTSPPLFPDNRTPLAENTVHPAFLSIARPLEFSAPCSVFRTGSQLKLQPVIPSQRMPACPLSKRWPLRRQNVTPHWIWAEIWVVMVFWLFLEEDGEVGFNEGLRYIFSFIFEG